MSKRIPVAVVTHEGGAHLSAYFPALANSPEVESVSLVDPSGKWVKLARKSLGERLTGVFRDQTSMRKKVDPPMVLVSMEAALAPGPIEAALQEGSHVMAEKPSCVRPQDFRRLARLADDNKRHLMLALANRLNPEVIAARKLIRDGSLGKMYGLEMHIIADQTRLTRPEYHKRWYAQKARAGGGHLIWLGIHWLDLAMFLTGESVEQVAGFVHNAGGQPLDVEDSAVAAMRFDSGWLGTVTSGFYVDRGYHSHIKIWGSQGWLHLEMMDDVPLRWYFNPGKQTAKDAGEIQQYTGPKEPRGYTPFVHAAVRAAAGLQDPPLTTADSLRVIETVFAIYRAAEEKRTTEISA